MSSIFGIFNRDGNTPDPAALEVMHKAQEYWNPDAQGSWSGGAIALGHCMLWNTPESRLENQPLVSNGEDGAMVIVADARLDNRADLADIFGLESKALVQTSDVDLLLLAWEKWRESSAEHLLGDFVFVVWDAHEQSLFCVRDHVGIRPLYYYLTRNSFIFSSDINVLLSIDDILHEINPEAMALYLTEGELLNTDLTFIQGIKKFPPASWMTLRGSELQSHTYWHAEDAPALNFDSVEDCATALRELLEVVVTDRLRTDYPVFSHLSGGLDSSSISVVAARHLAQKNLKLRSFNWVQQPGTEEDPDYYEWANAVKVAEQEGIDLKNVELNTADIIEDLRESDISLSDNLDFWYEPPIRKAVQLAGGRVILSGWGGDELISHPGHAVYAELFWHGCFTTAIRSILAEARLSERPLIRLLSLTLHKILVPVLPAGLRRRINTWYYSTTDYLQCAQPAFAAFVKQQKTDPWLRPALGNRAVQLALFNLGHIQNRVDCWAGSSWAQRLEYRYPLLDKRLVEFALGLPPEYFRQKGIGRFLFRQMCKELLPAEIHLHQSKLELHRVERMLNHEFEALGTLLAEYRVDAVASPVKFNEQFISLERVLSFHSALDTSPCSEISGKIDAADILIKGLRALRLGVIIKE